MMWLCLHKPTAAMGTHTRLLWCKASQTSGLDGGSVLQATPLLSVDDCEGGRVNLVITGRLLRPYTHVHMGSAN